MPVRVPPSMKEPVFAAFHRRPPRLDSDFTAGSQKRGSDDPDAGTVGARLDTRKSRAFFAMEVPSLSSNHSVMTRVQREEDRD